MLKIFLLSLILSISCQKQEDRKNITLKITAWEGYTPKKILDLFKARVEKKYDINLNYEITLPNNEEVMLKKLESKDVHIVSLSHYIYRDPLYKYYAKKLLHPIELKRIPNYKHIFSPFKKIDFVFEEDSFYGVPLAHASYRLMYNSALVDEVPKSWKVLYTPENRKKYIVSDYHFETNSYITALSLGARRNQLNRIELYQTEEYLQELKILAEGSKGYWDEVEKPSELIGKTYATGFGNFIHKLKKSGESWKFANPIEGEPAYIDFYSICSCIPKDSLEYIIAHEWVNYSLSIKYQLDVIINGLGEMPVTTDLKSQLSLEQIERYHLDDPLHFIKNSFFWNERTQELLNIQKESWESFLIKN